jgi:hypothetical protein
MEICQKLLVISNPTTRRKIGRLEGWKIDRIDQDWDWPGLSRLKLGKDWIEADWSWVGV